MIDIGQPLPAACGAWVRRHELVLIKDPDRQVGRADPELLPDQAMRRGVKRVVEHDVTVGMELGLLPLAHIERHGRQGLQSCLLDALEALPS